MSSLNYANILCSFAHRLAGRPCRLVLREANVVRKPEGSLINRFRTQALQGLMRHCYSKSDAVVANSYDTLQTLVDAKISDPDKTQVLFNPVITQKDIERPNINDSVLQTKSPYICAIGRLSEQKGFDILLDAFAMLKNNNLDLVILGEGELREALTEQARELGISERVHMPGFLDTPMAVLRKAEAFVLSSRWEGFGNVLVEALAAGVPVISTDCPGGPRAILEDGAHGHLVPYDDPGALAEGINHALEQPTGTPESRMARAADFSAEKIARKYLEKVLLPNE
jgi:glycosyltransferase involved in cell wall biosynthesis